MKHFVAAGCNRTLTTAHFRELMEDTCSNSSRKAGRVGTFLVHHKKVISYKAAVQVVALLGCSQVI